MGDTITVIGTVGTDPAGRTTANGTRLASFRLASTSRRQDRASGEWVDAGTNWYSVTAWRGLAANALASLSKGQRIIVVGEVTHRSFARADGTSGLSIDLEARSIGHDLRFQTSTAVRALGEHEGSRAPGADAVGATEQTPSEREATPERGPGDSAGALVSAAPGGWAAPGAWDDPGEDGAPF